MKPRILPIDISLFDLWRELSHTSALLHAYPFLSAQAASFDAVYPEWLQLLQDELALDREELDAMARTIIVDDGLDYLCVAISSTLLAENGGNRKAPAYLRYYGDAPPSKLKRPVLGNQLQVMRTWAPSLTAAESSAALQGYGRQLAERVTEADQVVRSLAESQRKKADFEIGGRKKFVDKLNALRQTVYGQVAEIPYKQPERNLPSDFATRFFLRDTSARKPTIGELEEDILRLRERLHKKEELLAKMLEEDDERARLEESEELAAAEQEFAEAERLRAEAAERLARARARKSK